MSSIYIYIYISEKSYITRRDVKIFSMKKQEHKQQVLKCTIRILHKDIIRYNLI